MYGLAFWILKHHFQEQNFPLIPGVYLGPYQKSVMERKMKIFIGLYLLLIFAKKLHHICRSSGSEVFCKIGVLKSFAKFTAKH